MPPPGLDRAIIRDKRQSKGIGDSMEKRAERTARESVKGKLKLLVGGLRMRRKPCFLLPPVCLSTARFPTLENRIQATTIVVVPFYIT